MERLSAFLSVHLRPSKTQLQSELNYPWSRRRPSDRPERGGHHHIIVRQREVHAVEGVEKLSAEFHLDRFFYRDCFDDR